MEIEKIITDKKILSIYKKYQNRMPFQVVEFANEIGIDVYADNMPSNISGKIKKQGDKFTCYINKKDAAHRQVFTIAHELGHYFRHQDWFQKHDTIEEKEVRELFNTFIDHRPKEYSEEQKKMEKQANEFAAELLMPENLIKEKWHELKSVNKMSKYFGVSEISMSIRLANVIGDIRFII